MRVITPDWPMPDNVGALSTVRSGGVSQGPYGDGHGGGGLNLGLHVGDNPECVNGNRQRLRALVPTEPAWLTQIHGTTVVDAATAEHAPSADGSFTNRPGVVCAIMTADCLPVLLCDAAGKVVGAAHAGWRGLASGVLEHTVAAMRDAGAGELRAWLGPAIGPAHFEVGPEVMDAFVNRHPETQTAFVPILHRNGKHLADLYLLAEQVLRRTGVAHIHGGGFCTFSDADRFYSYRRDQRTGRMASLIWIR